METRTRCGLRAVLASITQPRHNFPVQLNFSGRLHRKIPARRFNYHQSFSRVYVTADEEGVLEQITWAHEKYAEEITQSINSQVQNGLQLSNEEKWYNNLGAVKAYVKEHRRLPSRKDLGLGIFLGQWICRQRQEYKKWLRNEPSSMSTWRIAALEAVPGWDWFPMDTIWNAKLQKLKQYVEEHGELPTRTHPTLGMWISNQRYEHTILGAGKPSPRNRKRIEGLEAVPGWEWFPFEAAWKAKLQDLKQYVEDHGELPLTTHPTLGIWIHDQRCDYKASIAGKPSPMTVDRITSLEALPGWLWFPFEAAWNAKLEELTQYIEVHGEIAFTTHPTLGTWIAEQRHHYKTFMLGMPSPFNNNRVEGLETVPGWVWEVDEAEWLAKLEKLKSFVAEHGKLPVKRHPIVGGWISRQRTEYRKFREGRRSSMTLGRIATLEVVPGWVWEVNVEAMHQAEWDTAIKQVKQYLTEHNRLPPKRHPTLGNWLRRQREHYKKGELSCGRIAALESIPQWKWIGK